MSTPAARIALEQQPPLQQHSTQFRSTTKKQKLATNQRPTPTNKTNVPL
eukprot:COSAG01_NODE_61556_length_289_cov_0.500000_1_plen_48_part_10